MQLTHCNVDYLITAIAYDAWFNYTKGTNASGTDRRSTIVRRRTSGSRSVPVKVQLTVTVPEKKWSHKRKSKTSQKCPRHREYRFK
jgi:hypothetical protein